MGGATCEAVKVAPLAEWSCPTGASLAKLVLMLGGGNAAWTETVWSLCAIGGALVIVLFGATLFLASLGPARPF